MCVSVRINRPLGRYARPGTTNELMGRYSVPGIPNELTGRRVPVFLAVGVRGLTCDKIRQGKNGGLLANSRVRARKRCGGVLYRVQGVKAVRS